MKLFHISHTDLDGYTCQLLTKKFFKDINFLNANYGAEVKKSIVEFLDIIKTNEIKDEILFLITDVNLTMSESKFVDHEVMALNKEGYNITLQLLDHHITGEKCAVKYDWYLLDISRSATKITYDYLIETYDAYSKEEREVLAKLVNAVNAIDIWLEHETKNFEFGKVLLMMISYVREINNLIFPNLNRDFRHHLLETSIDYISLEDGNIKLDEDLHKIKKNYLNLDGVNDTIDNLSAKFLINSINEVKEDLTIFYEDKKGILTFTLGSISIPANAFLKSNPDYDFFIDVSRRGNASFRANGAINVGELAEKLAGGGGHPNAAGCRFDDFRDIANYNGVKNFIQSKLNNLK